VGKLHQVLMTMRLRARDRFDRCSAPEPAREHSGSHSTARAGLTPAHHRTSMTIINLRERVCETKAALRPLLLVVAGHAGAAWIGVGPVRCRDQACP